MISAPIPTNEAERLRSLQLLSVLDTPPEPEFDALVAAAALVCGVPIGLISLVDVERQWFKANVGLPGVTETPREVAFCAHAILDDGIFEVPDASIDPRFADNPLVASAPDIRFYAGATLRLSDGSHVGTLCVIDQVPHRLTEHQREVLRLLSVAAVQALESRRQALAFTESQERLRTLSELSPVGVFAADTEGLCTYTNAVWQQIYGITAAEALGTGWSRTLHPDDRAQVFAEWQRTAALKTDFDMEFRVQHDSGVVRVVRSLSRPVLNNSGEVLGYVGSVDDITERIAAQQKLRKSEDLLKRTGALAQVGGWELDLVSGYLAWSDETCRLHGLEPGHEPDLSEALGFFPPEARPIIEAAVAKGIAEGLSWDVELPLIQHGGQRIWVRSVGQAEYENGKAVRLVGVFKNITQRELQRQALESAQQRAILATENGGIGIWERDLQTGERHWSPRTYELFGLPPDCTDNPVALWNERVHPDDLNWVEAAMAQAISQRSQLSVQFRVVWSDGTVHHLGSSARVVTDGIGNGAQLVGVGWDITPLIELNTRLIHEHELLRVTLQSIGDAVITTDASGQVTWLNPVAERMTGWLCAEALGRPLEQVFHIVNEETRAQTENPVATCLRQGKVVGLANHTLLLSRNGEEFGIEDSAAPIRGEDGSVLGVVLVFHDVSEQRRLSGEMTYRATHDALTGLVNRAEFEARLRRALNSAHAEGKAHALLYIDLDQFKLVNDACGHSVGDQLLQRVAKLLQDTVRTRDTLARLGGDEFAVILEQCSAEQAQRVAQQICDRMEEFRFLHAERRFRIGASIGLVPLDNRWANSATLMQAADTSCYAAKEAGRNRVHLWFDSDKAMRARHGEMQWATRLEQALDENQFELFAQRIESCVAVAGGLHAEVLIRMRDAQGGLILPGAFLPAAERFHMATRIDRWVLGKVLVKLQSGVNLAALKTLCINLSGHSVGDRSFHRYAVEALTAAGPQVCQCLCLEITETSAVTNMADAAIFIEQVRALCVHIALDDFGAGASSFGYLKNLKVDVLKIDGSFIRDLIDDPLDDAAVRCFVDVALVVGVRTVAEFVDRQEVLDRVSELGIDYAQGYLLHKPEPIAQLFAAQGISTVG